MDKNLPQTFKLDDKGMKSLKTAVAELQAEALAKGIPYPFTEGDKLYERRPDGTRHEITTPVTDRSMPCLTDGLAG